MVVHIASSKTTKREGSFSPYSFYGQMLDCSVCNFQSMNRPMEMNSLFSKFFCYITMFVTLPDQTREWTTCKRGLYAKYYCFSETIAYGLKITNCISHTFSVLSTQSMSSSQRKRVSPRLHLIAFVFGVGQEAEEVQDSLV